jgi:hypothetical protein
MLVSAFKGDRLDPIEVESPTNCDRLEGIRVDFLVIIKSIEDRNFVGYRWLGNDSFLGCPSWIKARTAISLYLYYSRLSREIG